MAELKDAVNAKEASRKHEWSKVKRGGEKGEENRRNGTFFGKVFSIQSNAH